jgi:hypothetical protein
MFLFGKTYQQEMNVKVVDTEKANAAMPKLILMETMARVLYFLGLGILLIYTP